MNIDVVDKKTYRALKIILLFIGNVMVWATVLKPNSLESSLLIILPLYYLTISSIKKKPAKFSELSSVALWVCTFAIIYKVLGLFFGVVGALIFFVIMVLKIVINGVRSKAFKEGVDTLAPMFKEVSPWKKNKKKN